MNHATIDFAFWLEIPNITCSPSPVVHCPLFGLEIIFRRLNVIAESSL